MIKLNDKVIDRITGFSGIVIGRTEWLNGYTQLGVQSKKLEDGKPLAVEWFNEQRLNRVVGGESEPKDGSPMDERPSRM